MTEKASIKKASIKKAIRNRHSQSFKDEALEDRNYNRAFRSKVWVSNQIGCLLVLCKSGAV